MTATADGQTRPGAGGCPVRKLTQPDDALVPDVEEVAGAPGRLRIRSFELARQVLRHPDATRQAGFGAEEASRGGPSFRPPILYLEGDAHHAQRRAAARFFAPRTVEGYRGWMEETAEQLVAQMRTDGWTDVSRLSMQMAVQVASRVIGLDRAASPGMHRRLDAFFEPAPAARSPRARWHEVNRGTAVLRFFWLDVKPAIRARRRHRRDDLISRLLDDGFSDVEILTECVTYAAAGMVTTRELITVALWHLLDDDGLRGRYLAADRDGRVGVLEEVLRLEPVVGHLLRRTTAPLTLDGPDGPVEVPVGTVVDVDVRAANADTRTVGERPLGLCPARNLPRAVPPAVLAFGDGHHRCPGAPLAVMEAEIFLSALLRDEVAAAGPPRVRWNDVTQGYDLSALRVRRLPRRVPHAG